MHLREAQHLGVRNPVGLPGVMQVDALETLEEPAQRRTRRRLALLIGDRLSGCGEALAQAHLGQLVDQQAQRHDEGQRHDALRPFDEDRGSEEEGIFEESEATLHHRLFAIQGDDGLVGPGVGSSRLVPTTKAARRSASRSSATGSRVSVAWMRQVCGRGRGVVARSSAGGVARLREHGRGDDEPRRQPLTRLGQRRLGIGRAREGLRSPDARAVSPTSPDRAAPAAGRWRGPAPRPPGCAPRSSVRGPGAGPLLPAPPVSASRRRCCCQPSTVSSRSCTRACAAVDVSGTRLTQRTPACVELGHVLGAVEPTVGHVDARRLAADPAAAA